MIRRPYVLFIFLNILFSCQNSTMKTEQSFQLGIIAGFSELVNAGTKQLALSEPMSAAEMDALMEEAEGIAERNNVQLFREKDLLVTDLFPEEVAEGKEVLLIYKGLTLDAYQTLKKDKEELMSSGRYEGLAREQIARRFGRLLSYPEKRINELLAQQTDFRTLTDFNIQAGNVFLYYKDLAKATAFYEEVLGLEKVSDYGMATIFRIAPSSFLILVDAAEGMHTAEEPKTVALALLTDQLAEWYDYLQAQKVPIKYGYTPRTGNAHDGFVAVDPEGYLLEFEVFKQHPENERFMPVLNKAEHIFPQHASSKVPEGLGFKASITWLYYKDLLAMQNFYEQVLGFELVADQGWTKIYKVTNTSFIGLVDERQGMHNFTEKKAVNVSFLLEDVEGWFDYVKKKAPFELRSDELEMGPESKYKAFVGYDPEGYFMEFDRFLPHSDNEILLDYVESN
jgi:catechol 2,3-dioxygenase-like lactoylglutathione lyase family enzyme